MRLKGNGMAVGKIFTALALSFAFAGTAYSQSASKIWSLSPRPSAQLGLAFPGADAQNYPVVAKTGLGIVRLSVNWGRIEKQAGRYALAGLDNRIITLQKLGLEPFLTFESESKWATRPETRKVKNGSPNDMAQWQKFISTVVERYDGDGQQDVQGLLRPVKFFQAANEFVSPDNKSGGWAGSNAELLNYINASYSAVKSASSKAKFVLGGIAAFNLDVALVGTGKAKFTVQQYWSKSSKTVLSEQDIRSKRVQNLLNNRLLFVLKKAKYDYADAHLYGPEDRDPLRLQWLKSTSGKPVLSSECGGPSLDYGRSYSGHGHYKAVLERNLNTISSGAKFCLWFGLGEQIKSTYGNRKVQLFDKSRRPKPGVDAYKLLATLLNGNTKAKRLGSGAFTVGSGKKTTCIATRGTGFSAIQSACSGTEKAICIMDAKTQKAKFVSSQNLKQACPATSVVIAGNLAKTLLDH